MPKPLTSLTANSRAALLAVAVATVLTVAKFTLALVTGSLAVLASAVDSLLDISITAVNYFTIQAAARPPDADHRYGHGKFEAFASLIQAILIVLSGSYLGYLAIMRLLSPAALEYETWGLAVMAISMLASGLLAWYLARVVRRTDSMVLRAEAANFRADTLANLAVIIGLGIVSFTGNTTADAVVSLLMAGYIIFSAWSLLVECYDVLTDRELPDEVRRQIIGVIESTASDVVQGWHQLRTRRAGSQLHIDFHLHFIKGISLYDAHAATDVIEKKLEASFPDATVLIHLDPGPED